MDGTSCSTLGKILSEASAQAAPTSVDCPEFAFLAIPVKAGSWFLPQFIAYEGCLVLILAILWFAN